MPGTPIDDSPIGGTASLCATSDEVAKQAIQDAARYEEQLVKLILFHDDRALRVMSVYAPVIVALATAAVALNQTDKLSLYVGCMIGGTSASFFAGCLCAFSVIWTTPIYLPGRRPDFWNWATEHDVDLRSTAVAYVDQSKAMTAHNEARSNRASVRLSKAYICGMAAPFVGAATIWVVYWSRT
ncbi:hypothetical protein SAMN05216374_2477 [Tardiphaga sp. OK246]|jgi:hypothetical protein|nr:hypothetical protein SAMN05216374_2477 [Tardiphaga sp. OK246]